MLDKDGYRPNVGIILLNSRNEVFWGKRVKQHSWQFPQGGIKHGESPEQAMFRELWEEVGLKSEHVKIVGRTRDWLRYDVPEQWIRRELRGNYRGQKQIWFLLQTHGPRLRREPARDDPSGVRRMALARVLGAARAVIEFKRDVYQQALIELSRFVFRPGRPHQKASRPRSARFGSSTERGPDAPAATLQVSAPPGADST